MYKNLKILIIDVGHGGSDPGACANGIVEKIANLNTALGLKAAAESMGIKVFIIRDSDITQSLDYRVNYANNIAKKYPGAQILFVSIHHNAGGGDRAEAIHSIYRGEGQRAANLICDELQKHLGQAKKVYEKVGSDNKDYYYVIRNTSMDAVIVEVAFLDNTNDVQICDSIEEQRHNGQVIACAVGKFFGLIESCGEDVEAPKPTLPPIVEPPSTIDREIKRYHEKGKCTIIAKDGIIFRDAPSVANGKRQGVYECNEFVYYDLVVITDHYVWVSWIGASTGTRRYMPVLDKRNNKRWGNCV